MVNVTVIADHFEATIRDHPKMKLKEIQRRVASEIHVNVNLTRCKRAKKRVDERLSGNFKEEFALLWDYADELRAKNPADLDLEDGFGFTIISDQQKGNNNSNDPNSKSTSTTSVMSNTLSSSAHKEKQKQNTVDEMDQTYYSGLRSKAFNSHQMSINGSSVQRKSPNKKHKFIAYLINTQESTAQKQLKK
ncbi:hypothetical protein V6N12_025319 [Hibiscus sabdariffa]|uniref:Uncharacterized protein n=1 Tax=Hibiscus sabdariffa TaxID=183260 RepID=A0ABR2CI53_9ROSI